MSVCLQSIPIRKMRPRGHHVYRSALGTALISDNGVVLALHGIRAGLAQTVANQYAVDMPILIEAGITASRDPVQTQRVCGDC